MERKSKRERDSCKMIVSPLSSQTRPSLETATLNNTSLSKQPRVVKEKETALKMKI